MPGRELTYLMLMSDNLKSSDLDEILTYATQSNDGSEYNRLWQAISWKNLLSSGLGVLVTSTRDIVGTTISNWTQWKRNHIPTFQSFSTEGRKKLVNEIANDPDLPNFIKQNKEKISCFLKHLLTENSEWAQHPSRTIEQFIDVLPDIVGSLQASGCLKDISNITELGGIIISNILQDADIQSTTKEASHLYDSSRIIAEKFLEMTAAHPVVARNIMGRIAFSTTSPSHQQQMLNTLQGFKSEKGELKTGPDNQTRKDLAKLCSQYREHEKPDRLLLDTPLEAAVHTFNLANLHVTEATLDKDLHIEGFSFKETTLQPGFPPANSCFIKCDFSFAYIENNTRFNNCIIDADTLKTLLPSLRVAKASGKEVSLAGLKIYGDLSGLDLSYINFTGADMSHVTAMKGTNIYQTSLEHTNIPLKIKELSLEKERLPLTPRENAIRKHLLSVSNKAWKSLSRSTSTKISPRFVEEMVDQCYGFLVSKDSRNVPTLDPKEQEIIFLALKNHEEVFQSFVQNIEDGISPSDSFKRIVQMVQGNPEFTREYERSLDVEMSFLDPFIREFLSHVSPQVSDLERHVLTNIIQENLQPLSRKFDSLPGDKKEKAVLLLEEIKMNPQFKFRKEIQEFRPQSLYFENHHIESLRALFIEVGCGPFLNTVEYESKEKNPPTMFGTTFQKALCFLFPNLRNIFGKGTKFGDTLASRSFSQICQLVFYFITHPIKIRKILQDSIYVMDQIGWISWKEPRYIDEAQKELVTKLVKQGVVSDLLKNERLPMLSISTTTLFPTSRDAREVIAVALELLKALEVTGVTKNIEGLISGDTKQKLKILSPFISHVIKSGLLDKINPETINFITTHMNERLTVQNKTKLSTQEVKSLIESGKKIASVLEKYNIVDDVETILLASNTTRLEILQKTIQDPNHLSDIIRNISELEEMTAPILRKTLSDISKKPDHKTGTIFWYEPHQIKFDRLYLAKKTIPDTAINLNTEFNACSFGNIELRGMPENLLNWTNMQAEKFDMWGAKIEYVKFDGSKFTGYSNPITSKFYFRGASFDHAQIEHCDLNNVQLKYAYMQDTSLKHCKAENLELSHADMIYASIEHSQLQKVSFVEVNLYGGYITNSTLEDCNFSHVKGEYVVFKNIFKGNTSFEGAHLENASFSGSHFEGNIIFKGAILKNTALDNITLSRGSTIDLDKAIISEENFKKLQEKFPHQIRNASSAIIIQETVVQNLKPKKWTKTNVPKRTIDLTEREKHKLRKVLGSKPTTVTRG